jgi:hypothetical protein
MTFAEKYNSPSQWRRGWPLADAFSYCLAVLRDVAVLSTSVQCIFVKFCRLAKEDQAFEKC